MRWVTRRDEETLIETLQQLAPALLAYFRRRVNSPEDAVDLLAELMAQVWLRADTMPTETEQQRMWLYTFARNILHNHGRATQRRSALFERICAELHAIESVVDSSEAVAVRDAVRRLPDAQRELVMLIHWDGLTVNEAAMHLGLNPSTARSRYASARQSLANALATSAEL